MPDIDQ